MSKASALVFIFTLDANSSSTKNLSAKFPSPYFNVQLAEVENPNNSTSWTPERLEAHRMKVVLSESSAAAPNMPVLVIKDNATTTWSGNDIQQVVAQVAQRNKWSYANLSSYNNSCDKLSDPQTLANGAHLYNAPSTNGNAALLFSPATRDILIGKTLGPDGKPIVPDLRSINNTLSALVRSGTIEKPIIIAPNVFHYDVTKAGKNVNANYCSGDSAGGSGAGLGLGFLLLILFLLLVLFLIFRRR